MNKKNSTWLRIAPYLLGAVLFFVGAVRFLLREDIVGTVIFSIAGLLAVYMLYLNLSRRGTSGN